MDPITIAMLAAQLGPAVMQFFKGRKQAKQGNALGEGLVDPVYNIPASATTALASAQDQARNMSLPGATNLQNKIDQGTANATSSVLRASRSPLDALSAITQIQGNNLDNQSELGYRTAQNYNSNQGMLRQQLGMMAGFEDKKWTNDVLNRFLRDSAAASALKNAGTTNQYNAVKTGFNAIGSVGGMAREDANLDKILKSFSAGGTNTGGAFDKYNTGSAEQPESGLQTPQTAGFTGPSSPGYKPEDLQGILDYFKTGGSMSYNPMFG
jgi:hypothetical protein